MTDKNRNLLLRIISSVILLPLVVWLVFLGGYPLGVLLAAAAGITASEYYLITLGKLGPAEWVGIFASALIPVLPMWAQASGHSPERATEHAGDIAFWWSAGFFFFAWTYHLISGKRGHPEELKDAPKHVGHLFVGFLYGAFGMMAVTELRGQPSFGLSWVITTLVITWGNDTMAYFTGRFLGRHKLYPEVSPNKTWEGFAGGLLLGSIGGLFIYRGIGLWLHWWTTPLTPIDCVLVGAAGGILGPIGDLSESMLKRAYKVKDSGKIIPGHGGLLDRIDALLFNAPMVFLYVHFVRHFVSG